jgi:hypothetical protein
MANPYHGTELFSSPKITSLLTAVCSATINELFALLLNLGSPIYESLVHYIKKTNSLSEMFKCMISNKRSLILSPCLNIK